MTPLASWICDSCQNEIDNPSGALVVWRMDSEFHYGDFRIVHKGPRCDPERDMLSLELSDFVGANGLALLLSWLSLGPIRRGEKRQRIVDMDKFVDLVRRLHTPAYEEARQYFGMGTVRDAYVESREDAPYVPASLKHIIEMGQEED